MRSPIVIATLLAATFAGPARSWAFECSHSNTSCYAALRWQSRVIPFVVRLPPADSRTPQELLVRAAQRSAERWSAIECSDISLEYRGLVGAEAEIENSNQVIVINHDWKTVGRKPGQAPRSWDAVGLTTVSSDALTGTIGHAIVELNEERFDFFDTTLVCSGHEPVDLEGVLTHEFGHLLGLAHPCEFPGSSAYVPGPAAPETLEPDAPEDPWSREREVASELMADDDRARCPTPSCADIDDSNPFDRPTMWPMVDQGEPGVCDEHWRIQRSLGPDDLDGLCTIYPTSGNAVNCRSLPPEAKISSAPFGCQTSKSTGHPSLLSFLALAGLGALVRRRSSGRQVVSKTTRAR